MPHRRSTTPRHHRALYAIILVCVALGGMMVIRSASASSSSFSSGAPPPCDAAASTALLYRATTATSSSDDTADLSAAIGGLWERKMATKDIFKTVLSAKSLSVRKIATDLNDLASSFVVVLNPSRAQKRMERPPSEVEPVLRPWSEKGFNFGKVGAREVMFRLQEGVGGANSAVNAGGFACATESALAAAPHSVVVNVSPFDMHSSLLVPFIRERRPQALEEDALRVALRFAAAHVRDGGSGDVANAAALRRAGNPTPLRVGFNSGGGGASVNHLHFQIWRPAGGILPVEYAATLASRPLRDGAGGVRISELADGYPVRGFVLDGVRRSEAAREAAARAVSRCAARLAAGSFPFPSSPALPFNLVLTGDRIFFWPRQEMHLFLPKNMDKK